MTTPRSAAGAVAIRLDDIHARTPLAALESFNRHLWRGKPLTNAVIPYPARLSLGPAASKAEIPGPRSTITDSPLTDHLDAGIRRGSDVALHGLTHADHKTPQGPAVPELVAVAPGRDALLHRALDTWRHRFATTVLVPPHNAVHPELAARCTARGYAISRSLTDPEVAALGFDPSDPEARTQAKRMRTERKESCGIEVFQTIGLSRRFLRTCGKSPSEIATELALTAREAGIATVTFHWWDFVRADQTTDTAMQSYAAEALDALSSRVEFTTISGHARR
jgi:hypothetical protein